MAPRFKAILFDFDGVLGKTMEDNYKAWKNALLKYGISIDKEKYFLMEGMASLKLAQYFLRKNRLDVKSAGAIARLKEKYYSEDNSFSLYPGAKDLLRRLKKEGFLLGLVTGGSRKRIYNSRINGFLSHFDVVITAQNSLKGKPHPMPYLTAAKKLGLKPRDCLVVENAPLGIQAAKSAKMKCIAVTSTLPRKHLKRADHIVSHLKLTCRKVSS